MLSIITLGINKNDEIQLNRLLRDTDVMKARSKEVFLEKKHF